MSEAVTVRGQEPLTGRSGEQSAAPPPNARFRSPPSENPVQR